VECDVWRKRSERFPLGGEKEEDFYDDCPICQLLKRCKNEGREPNEAELRQAFEQAKQEGAIVGREWFQEPKEKQD